MDGLDNRRDQRFALVEVDDLLSDLGDVWGEVISHFKTIESNRNVLEPVMPNFS